MTNTIDAGIFYAEYHGHPVSHLEQLHDRLAKEAETTIWLTGDSSLDNKHWFFDPYQTKKYQVYSGAASTFIGNAVNGYEKILRPAHMVKDVAFWMNSIAAERYGSGKILTINASIEESTIGERMASTTGLLPHDEFVRDHCRANDVIVLSVGGNDVALKPTLATIASVFSLTRCPMWLLRRCGSWSPGWSHMENLLHDRIEEIVQRMTNSPNQTPPKKIIVCMIYFLDQQPGDSWADGTLAALGYNSNPDKLQLIIRMLFERISARGFKVKRASTGVMCFPLFEVLDGTDTNDYIQRVEPSVQGGKKIANKLLRFIFDQKPQPEK